MHRPQPCCLKVANWPVGRCSDWVSAVLLALPNELMNALHCGCPPLPRWLLDQVSDVQPLLLMPTPQGTMTIGVLMHRRQFCLSTHKLLVLPALQVPSMVKGNSLLIACICMSELDSLLSDTRAGFSLPVRLWASRALSSPRLLLTPGHCEQKHLDLRRSQAPSLTHRLKCF